MSVTMAAGQAVYSLLTLYMMLILVTWLASPLQLDLRARRLRWIPALTQPLIRRVRRILPNMGPVDFGPLATLFLVWIVRTLATAFLMGLATAGQGRPV